MGKTIAEQGLPDRQRSQRAAGFFVVAILVTITVICGSFLVLDVEIPNWFVIVGRWIPAIVAAVVVVTYRLPGGILDWMQLKPHGLLRTAWWSFQGVIALMIVYVLIAVVYPGVGSQSWDRIGLALLWGVPMAVLFVLSTIGEEAAWRGFLQKAWTGWGFWPSSVVIALIWVVFHVPLHGAMVLQGVLEPGIAIASTAVLFGLGIFLSALTVRFKSVWPAAFAHALPMSVLNLVQDPEALSSGQLAGITVATTIVLLVLAALCAPRNAPSAQPDPAPASGTTA